MQVSVAAGVAEAEAPLMAGDPRGWCRAGALLRSWPNQVSIYVHPAAELSWTNNVQGVNLA